MRRCGLSFALVVKRTGPDVPCRGATIMTSSSTILANKPAPKKNLAEIKRKLLDSPAGSELGGDVT